MAAAGNQTEPPKHIARENPFSPFPPMFRVLASRSLAKAAPRSTFRVSISSARSQGESSLVKRECSTRPSTPSRSQAVGFGEHTPPACGLRRLAANFVSPYCCNQTMGQDGGHKADGATPSAARETRALPRNFIPPGLVVGKGPRKMKNYQTNPSWIFQSTHKQRRFLTKGIKHQKKRTHLRPHQYHKPPSDFRPLTSDLCAPTTSANLLKPVRRGGMPESLLPKKQAAPKRAPLRMFFEIQLTG